MVIDIMAALVVVRRVFQGQYLEKWLTNLEVDPMLASWTLLSGINETTSITRQAFQMHR